MKILSPAKVNLFLNVAKKRPDGYHQLETLYERIGLFDEIEINSQKKGIDVRTDKPSIPQGAANLAYAAAKLLIEKAAVRRGVSIKIKKRIPAEAGLGGGSSNAATVLLGLDRYWKLGLPQKNLLDLGTKLGSDVAFFVLDKPFAIGTGRGEILKPLTRANLKIWHCLVKPNYGISTKAAYRRLDKLPKQSRGLFLTHPMADARMLFLSIQNNDSLRLSKYLINSLELALGHKDTKILELKQKLLNMGAMGALMSGSGSTVFGIFSSKKEAQKTAESLKRDQSLQVFVAATY